MAIIYFPGCKYSALSPSSTEKIKGYLAEKRQVTITGCCRKHWNSLAPGDEAMFVCPTCQINVKAWMPKVQTRSIWEFLAEDDFFPWPDYSGEEITIQDCQDSNGNITMRLAVRHLLNQMNFSTWELEGFHDAISSFCNLSISHREENVLAHCNTFIKKKRFATVLVAYVLWPSVDERRPFVGFTHRKSSLIGIHI